MESLRSEFRIRTLIDRSNDDSSAISMSSLPSERDSAPASIVDHHSSFNQDEEKWETSGAWPPLLGGWRQGHATVTITDEEASSAVVVLGGITIQACGKKKKVQKPLSSVVMLDLWRNGTEPSKSWREGPPLNQERSNLNAVVCSGRVYVLGGNINSDGCLDTIERMDIADLVRKQDEFDLKSSQQGASPASTDTQFWRTLPCNL